MNQEAEVAESMTEALRNINTALDYIYGGVECSEDLVGLGEEIYTQALLLKRKAFECHIISESV
jgi:hypothetical protein